MVDKKKPIPHKTITVDLSVYARLDKAREFYEKSVKLPKLSWNQFLSRVADTYASTKLEGK